MLGVREFIELPDIPIDTISEFVEGKRDKLWEIEINGDSLMYVHATKKSAKILLEMLADTKVDFLPLAPLAKENIAAFIAGDREDLLNGVKARFWENNR